MFILVDIASNYTADKTINHDVTGCVDLYSKSAVSLCEALEDCASLVA